MTLRLNHEFSWAALQKLLLRHCSSDMEQLQRAHDSFVRDMADACLLNEASHPLFKAVQQVFSCCEQAAASEGLSEVIAVVEPAFDASSQMFVRVIEGMLRQRQVLHLQTLLGMLRFNQQDDGGIGV